MYEKTVDNLRVPFQILMLHPKSYAGGNVATNSVLQARLVKCEVPDPGNIS